MEEKIALHVNDEDNVAVVMSEGVRAGDAVTVRDKTGKETAVTALGDIPFGHKIAVRDIEAGREVRKYGEVIGGATADIAAGDYVHVHNMDSLRGRGDLAAE